jgi:predicted enzyme related to lactoylglutathione lyase
MTTPAATAATSSYTPAPTAGRFVWHDLNTPDVEKALAFYQALFGWTTTPMDMGEMGTYTIVEANGQGLGGVVPLDAASGTPPHWIAYISTPDVDATTAHAQSIGATAHVPPTDIPNVGRFAVVADPTGAVFSPFRGDGPDMPTPPIPPAGTVCWNELMSKDAAGAATFYPALFGWTHESMDMGPMGTYHLFKRDGQFVAGMMQMPPDAPAPSSHWIPYFAVASADAATAQMTALGASVMHGPVDIQDWGRMTVAMDPTGAMFAVLENKTPGTAESGTADR